ncbi:MAG: hypothetical protein WCT20_00935 [Candidatus Babeliales bacterium]
MNIRIIALITLFCSTVIGNANAALANISTPTTGGKSIKLIGHKDRIQCMSLSCDEFFIATGAADNTVKLWDRITGNLYKSFDFDSEIEAVAFNPNSNKAEIFATATANGIVGLWDSRSFKNICYVDVQPQRQQSFNSSTQPLKIDDLLSDLTINSSDEETLLPISHLIWGPLGESLAVELGQWNTSHHKILLFKFQNNALKTEAALNHSKSSSTFSCDETYFAAAHCDGINNGRAKIHHMIHTGNDADFIIYERGTVEHVIFNPINHRLAVSSLGDGLRIYNLAQKNCRSFLNLDCGRVGFLATRPAWSPNGKLIAAPSSADADTHTEDISVWNLCGDCMACFRGESKHIYGLQWSPDGRYIASTSSGDESDKYVVSIWDFETQKLVTKLDGAFLAWGRDSKTITIALSNENNLDEHSYSLTLQTFSISDK